MSTKKYINRFEFVWSAKKEIRHFFKSIYNRSLAKPRQMLREEEIHSI